MQEIHFFHIWKETLSFWNNADVITWGFLFWVLNFLKVYFISLSKLHRLIVFIYTLVLLLYESVVLSFPVFFILKSQLRRYNNILLFSPWLEHNTIHLCEFSFRLNYFCFRNPVRKSSLQKERLICHFEHFEIMLTSSIWNIYLDLFVF